VKIAVDAMGGDHAPAAAVEGALRASREWGIQVILVGREADVASLVGKHRSVEGIEIHDAPDVVEMHEPPAQAVRRKKDASLVVCADLVKQGRAAGMFSAGNTGAGMAVSLMKFGRIPGIDRPAIAILLPNRTGGYTVLLDAGANVDVDADCLAQYAVMGSIYSRELLGVPEPRVGLVNIGEEEGKGNELVRDAFPLIRQAPVRFIGNIEGPDLYNGRVDVAVCDGFTGNVVLKVSEGVAEFFMHLIKEEVHSHPVLQVPAAMLKPAFSRIRRRTDYGEKGGAPLLGVNGVCIIAHGRSNPVAIANGIRTAAEAVRHGIIDKIREQAAH
jgi:glycerol-3-phosphate acyltransferase PlsX